MDTPSGPEENVTDSCVQGDGEKDVDAQTSAGAEDGEKAMDSTTFLSPPRPVPETGDRNEPYALANLSRPFGNSQCASADTRFDVRNRRKM